MLVTHTPLRIVTPCSENLDAMPRTKDGAYLCAKCDRAVVDLRHARKKRALAVIAELKRESQDGSVCVRVRATGNGVPVFAPDPSPFARFIGPVALATSLAACSAQTSAVAHDTTPAVLVEQRVPSNGNAPTSVPPTHAVTTPTTTPRNVSYPPPVIYEVAGGLG